MKDATAEEEITLVEGSPRSPLPVKPVDLVKRIEASQMNDRQLLIEILREVREYRSELVDPGKTLDKFGRDIRDQLEEVKSSMSGNLTLLWSGVQEEGADLRDQLTRINLHLGLIEKPTGAPHDVRVLIVDDDKQIENLLVRLCRTRSMNVFSASGPAGAEKILKENPIDVVLTDVAMAHNGSKLHEFVREKHSGVEVILMSGYPDVARQAEESGAFYFLKKPFTDIGNDGVVLAIVRAAERRYERRHGVRVRR